MNHRAPTPAMLAQRDQDNAHNSAVLDSIVAHMRRRIDSGQTYWQAEEEFHGQIHAARAGVGCVLLMAALRRLVGHAPPVRATAPDGPAALVPRHCPTCHCGPTGQTHPSLPRDHVVRHGDVLDDGHIADPDPGGLS